MQHNLCGIPQYCLPVVVIGVAMVGWLAIIVSFIISMVRCFDCGWFCCEWNSYTDYDTFVFAVKDNTSK